MKVVDEDGSVLDLFRGPGNCGHCKRSCHRQPHHIFCRGIGGGSQLDIRTNLIGLCQICHRMFHDGNISREKLIEFVAEREKKTPEEVVRIKDRILQLPKGSSMKEVEKILHGGK